MKDGMDHSLNAKRIERECKLADNLKALGFVSMQRGLKELFAEPFLFD